MRILTDRASAMKPYQVMQAALKKVDRDILYSLCQYGGNEVWEWGPQVEGQFVAHDRRHSRQLAKPDRYLGSTSESRLAVTRGRATGTMPI